MAKYTRERTQLLDWIETNREIKEQANQNFTNTDYAFKLYNLAHPDQRLTLPKEPKFSDMYQPSELQKQGELLFVGGSVLALGYAAFRFLQTYLPYKEMEAKLSKTYYCPEGYGKAPLPSKN